VQLAFTGLLKLQKPLSLTAGRKFTMSQQEPIGKPRNPATAILLTIVTLGIYGIVWIYSTLDELKNYRGQGWSGLLYLLFQFLFPFPLIALPWLIPAYVGNLYAEEGRGKPITGSSGFWMFLPIIGAIVWFFKVQGSLNNFWNAQRAGAVVPA
jgi:hypothetical protein